MILTSSRHSWARLSIWNFPSAERLKTVRKTDWTTSSPSTRPETFRETLRILEEENLLASAAAMGRRIRDGFAAALQGVRGVVAIRGQGLMIGIELDRPCGDLVRQALASRLLINVTQDRVIRLLPPLVIDAGEADEIVARLAPLVRAFVGAPEQRAA